MTERGDLDALEELVRGRMRLAAADKALFEREGQRLNGQLMQGELNMAAVVLAWLERTRAGDPAPPVEDEADDEG